VLEMKIKRKFQEKNPLKVSKYFSTRRNERKIEIEKLK